MDSGVGDSSSEAAGRGIPRRKGRWNGEGRASGTLMVTASVDGIPSGSVKIAVIGKRGEGQ